MNDDYMEFFTGFQDHISTCCVLFYECSWLPSIRLKIPEYAEKMWKLSNKSGILLCPECLVSVIDSDNKIKSEINFLKDSIRTIVQ